MGLGQQAVSKRELLKPPNVALYSAVPVALSSITISLAAPRLIVNI